MEVEVYQEHTGALPALTGTTTYRLYAVCENQTDFLSSIFGVAGSPLEVNTSTTFYQNPFGGVNGSSINVAFYAFFPELEFDSWVTIGRASSDDLGAQVNVVQSSSDPWIDEFELGQNIIIDGDFGGSWFTINGVNSVNGIAGADFKVLIGQFTTSGIFSGFINAQVFLNGDNNLDEVAEQIPFSSNSAAVFGCTNPEAINFDPLATDDNGTCAFACALTLDGITSVIPSCFGENDGNLTFLTSGGQGAVTYQLNGGNEFLNNSFNGLSAGTYDLIIQDGQGCEIIQQVTLDDPPEFILSAENKQNVSCNGAGDGSIDIITQGGTGVLMFGLQPGVFTQSSPDFTGFVPGTYTVYGIDENGCTAQIPSFSITQPLAIQISITAATNSSCASISDGLIVVLSFGGAGGIQYALNGIDFQASNVFSVSAGTYNVTVEDNNGCQLTSADIVIGSNGIEGCTDVAACNFNPNATCENGSCGVFDECGNCGGNATAGCTDAGACNYDATASCDDSSCEFDSCAGCTDPVACSYDPTATIEDGSCLAEDECGNCGGNATAGCTDAGACNYDATASCDDSSCEFDSCAGCTDPAACNYDPTATIEDGSCLSEDECGNCGGNATAGCTDAGACNYDATASCDDSSCEFDSCAGCTDPEACNYDPIATIEDGSCLAEDECGNCGGNATAGCTDAGACNYDATASCDDSSCEFDS
ncbi:MAG: hypothetical protein ACJAU0_001585, partial [Flavobacteriales bacterium]